MIPKVIKIIGPDGREDHHSLYVVHVAEHSTPIHCHKEQVDLMMFENEMANMGINPSHIEKHRKLVLENERDEVARGGECY